MITNNKNTNLQKTEESNMKVLFQNSRGVTREIAEVSTTKEAYQEINKFCEERNFTIHYTRGWINDDGMTVIDVGSHTEFFHIVE